MFDAATTRNTEARARPDSNTVYEERRSVEEYRSIWYPNVYAPFEHA